MNNIDNKIYLTESLMIEMIKFQKHVQAQSDDGVCISLFQIFPESEAEPVFRVSAEPVSGVKSAKWYLVDGSLVAIIANEKHSSELYESVFWLRDIDNLIVQIWAKTDFEYEFGVAQGNLLACREAKFTLASFAVPLS